LTVSQENEDGARFIEALLGPGEFFGELALVEGASAVSTVQAESDCELLFVPRRELVRVLYDDPRVAFSMLNMALARLADAHSALERLGLMNVSQRVAHVVLHTVRGVGGELRVELAAGRIAEMVGASREMISRVIGRMIRAGIVRRDGAALVVLDPAALALRSLCMQPASRVNAASPSETFA
jgi:CRP-like cAMP-binding protein